MDKWGLRKLSDGSIQIEPIYDWIEIKRDYGFTMVFQEASNYQRFNKTETRTFQNFGLVNNEVGRLSLIHI